MEITRDTTVGEAMPFLNEEYMEELVASKKVPMVPYGKSILTMTVGQFLECLDKDYAKRFFDDPEKPLVTAVGNLKWFKKQIEDIKKVLELNEFKLSPEEEKAQIGVVFPSFAESVLCECVEWFHLHSLDDAEGVPFSNYLVMRRKHSAEALYERNLNKIYTEKAKRKTK